MQVHILAYSSGMASRSQNSMQTGNILGFHIHKVVLRTYGPRLDAFQVVAHLRGLNCFQSNHWRAEVLSSGAIMVNTNAAKAIDDGQIGRASWWEREGQYV